MSDWFYNFAWYSAYHVFWLSSSPTVIYPEVTRRAGAYILAANHQSPYDIPLLIRHTRRNVDFVSIVEVFRNPLVAWLYGSMNAFPLDRSKSDPRTIRVILDRLANGRVVGMFPEGQIRQPDHSVLAGGSIRKGIGRIARMANAPIIPVVVLNSGVYSHFSSWLPLRRVRYGIIYGQPLETNPSLDPENADADLENRLVAQLRELHAELSARFSPEALGVRSQDA